MIIFQVGVILLFLLAAPVLLGLPWTNILPRENRFRLLATLPMGFFTELTIFHFLAVPFAFLGGSFSLLCYLFAGCTAACCVWGAIRIRKTKPLNKTVMSVSGWEWIYLAVFIALLGWQLFNGYRLDPTIWTYDDAAYVGYAADALRFDRIQTIEPSTGLAMVPIATRCIQASLYFPAMLSLFSSVPVTTMERTVLQVYNIFLAYTVYAYMAAVICKKKEDGLIFLILLSVLHIYGYYSQYSITFRLLGPNYQGKAVLAASLFPFLFTFLIQKLQEEYDWKAGALLLVISSAATSLTLFGIPTMMMNTALVVVLSLFRKDRKWKHLIYLPWAGVIPTVFGCIYFVYKIFRW